MNVLTPPEQLATALSVAVRIEPELIRAVRLAVFPRLDVSAEADLWFSPLVRSRGPHGIVLDDDVLSGLRARLSSWLRKAPESDPVHDIGEIIASVHKRLSPVLALEERVNWLAITGNVQAIDNELRPALKALVQENRTGIRDWFTAAWHRLPDNARHSVVAWKLAQIVRPDLRSATAPALRLERTLLTQPDLADIVPLLRDTRLLLRRIGNQLEIGDFTPDHRTVGILVPDTDPRLLDVGSLGPVAVRKGSSERVRVGPGPVKVTTARGSVYEVAAPATPANRFLGIKGPRLSETRSAIDELRDALGDDFDATVISTSSADAVQEALFDMTSQGSAIGTLVIAVRGSAGVTSDQVRLVLEEHRRGRGSGNILFLDFLDACFSLRAKQILVILDLDLAHDVPTYLWERASEVVRPSRPRQQWVGVAMTRTTLAGGRLCARLTGLLTAGPDSAANKQGWPVGTERLTGTEIGRALVDKAVDGRFSFMEAGQPERMLRNPLFGQDIFEPAALPIDLSAEVQIALDWVRSGSADLRVITGSPESGTTTLLNEVAREAGLVHLRGSRIGELADLPSTLATTVAIHALHEGGEDAIRALAEFLRRDTPPGLVLVTVSGSWPLLPEIAPDGADLDLDDLHGYVARRLPGPDEHTIASFVIDELKLPPLLTRRLATQLAGNQVTTEQTDWQRQVVDALVFAFTEDIERYPYAWWFLLPLAWAGGRGMPRDEWFACASAIASGERLRSRMTLEVLRDLAPYVVTDHLLHRLAHHTLTEWLRENSTPSLLERMVAALVELVRPDATESEYLRRYLGWHAVCAGLPGLIHLRALADRNRRWLPDLAEAAHELALQRGERSVEFAREAVDVWTRLADSDPTFQSNLGRSTELLRTLLNEDGRSPHTGRAFVITVSIASKPLYSLVVQILDRTPAKRARSGNVGPRDMVIVVPGVKGNILFGPDGRRTLAPALPEDIGDEHPGDHVVPGVVSNATYGTLLDRLRAQGYREDLGNLLALPYDWRLSHRWTGRWLGARAEDALLRWRERGQSDGKVVFVCGATGGLPVRWYVERCGGAEITSRVITIGTPSRGSVHRLRQLVNGTAPSTRSEFWRSLPSMYQALPVHPCVERAGELLRVTDIGLPHLHPHLVADGVAFLDDLLEAQRSRPDDLHATEIGAVDQVQETAVRIVGGRVRLPQNVDIEEVQDQLRSDDVLDNLSGILAARDLSAPA